MPSFNGFRAVIQAAKIPHLPSFFSIESPQKSPHSTRLQTASGNRNDSSRDDWKKRATGGQTWPYAPPHRCEKGEDSHGAKIGAEGLGFLGPARQRGKPMSETPRIALRWSALNIGTRHLSESRLAGPTTQTTPHNSRHAVRKLQSQQTPLLFDQPQFAVRRNSSLPAHKRALAVTRITFSVVLGGVL